jgi:hypothetical protein
MPLLARLQQILHTDYASHDVEVSAVTARLKREFSAATVSARTDDINKAVLLFEGTDPTRRVNDEDNEEEVVPGRGVWLAKRGEGAGVLTGSKKRYFVLVKGALSHLLRFNYYAAFRNGFPADKKGAIELFPGTVCSVNGTLLIIVSRTHTHTLSLSLSLSLSHSLTLSLTLSLSHSLTHSHPCRILASAFGS